MSWFRIDDSFYDHPKVFDAPDCAVALWVRAGTWSARNLTDGYVPTRMPARLCDDPETAVRELLRRGLWSRIKDGYRFHDWIEYQPTRDEAMTAKANQSSGGAIGNHRRWHVARGVSDDRCRYCQPKRASPTDRVPDRVPDIGTESHPNPPARPDPSLRGTGRREAHGYARATPEPPRQCPQHADDPDPPPCGPCADARRTHETWEANRPTPNRLTGSPDFDARDRNATRGPRRQALAAAARATLNQRTQENTHA